MPAAATESPHTTAQRPDGRAARAARTRAAIADAMLSLIEDGTLRPTAPMVAQRAGVALRSVFQHFEDMDGLQASVIARQAERVPVAIAEIDPSLPLPRRVEAFVAERARVYEAIAPVRRAATLSEPFSEAIHHRMQATRDLARREALATFDRELRSLPAADRRVAAEAIAVCTSWALWEEMRAHRSLTVHQASNVLQRTLSALLSRERKQRHGRA